MKKIIALTASLVMCAAAVFTPMQSALTQSSVTEAASDSSYNYGEALQKSMFFYEVQQSGVLPEWNKVSWRADSMVNDYVTGGWYDAGDHLKFTLTNAYSATLLGWGLLQYEEGVEIAGELEEYRNNLSWGLDYLVGCDLGDEIVYMIGQGAFDHQWWGSAEVYMAKFELMGNGTERPYYTCQNSSIEAQMAAALAVGYLCFKDCDAERAETYLTHAKDLFERADAYRAIGGDDAETSYYNISSFYDDLFLAANWLYQATGDQSYLDLCESDYIPNLGKEEQSDELKYTWGYCWDDVQQAATLLYAVNTGDATWKNQVKKHLEYWTTGYGGKQITYTPDGLAWLFQWGSLRHATTTAFLAYVAVDELFSDDASLSTKYTDFADSQMNYCFGDNDNNYSYVIGMGDTYPQAWHHRTSSGVWNDKWSGIGLTEGEDAKSHAHTLYGALVGGPDSSGSYSDKIGDYQYSEVAIDYNAGYTAALCAMVEKYGGSSDPDFPPTETPKWDEFYVEACINQASSNFTEIKLQATNHTAWPARIVHSMSVNYYFDISEVLEAGYTADDLTVKIGYAEYNCTISDPIQYDGTLYYVKITFEDDAKIMPSGQSEHQAEVQFRISAPDGTSFWNADNDYSYQNLVKQDVAITSYITQYDGDTLIWGTEPDGTTPQTATEATTSVTEATTDSGNVNYGDANVDGSVNVLDVIVLNKSLMGSGDISEQGALNADVDLSGKLSAADSLLIMKYIVHLIDGLPVTA